MRYFYALLLLVLGLSYSVQAQQPFLKYGVRVKVATLSNGRFQEFFTNDSLRRIGSVVYDTRLRRVAYLLPPDSLVGHAKPDITSRWMSPDPLAEKFMYISPYAYGNNNPIRYNDPDGREFTDPAKKRVEAYGQELQSRIASNNEKVAGLRGKIEGGGLSDKQLARTNKQIDRLQGATTEYQAAQGEIATLSASSQVYDIQAGEGYSDATTSRSATSFNFNTGVVEITLSGAPGFGLLAHELKHAYQFETGNFSVGPSLPGVAYSNLLYDKQDEVAAYARGSLFGQTAYGLGNLPAEYNDRATGPYNASNVPIIGATLGARNQQQLLQNAAIRTGHAFRVDGKTYYKQR